MSHAKLPCRPAILPDAVALDAAQDRHTGWEEHRGGSVSSSWARGWHGLRARAGRKQRGRWRCITHTAAGTRIIVTAGRVDGNVRLAVRDDGRGIDPQLLQRIFEPFYTADDAQGSGLGLAIASELAERMSGQLSVRSAPGETTFTLEIPE